MLDPRRAIVQRHVYVWDPFVRAAHWALAAAVATAYLVVERISAHVWAGAIVAALVAARLVWGFIGPPHARFADFLYPPNTVLRYVRDLLGLREHGRYLGHSPGGGYVILALFAVLAATAATGLLAYSGLLAGAAPAAALWHGILADITLGLIAVHIVGVLLRSFVYRQNLIRAQITGYKRP